MESPANNIICVSISLFGLFLSFSFILIPVLAIQECDVPAIFNFGDSNSDTGGFSAAYFQIPSPNGKTFSNMPAGKNSDGRLIINFIGIGFLFCYYIKFLL